MRLHASLEEIKGFRSVSIRSHFFKTSVLTYQIPRAYSQMTVLFSSPNLTSGGSYTISKGGTVSGGSEFFGLYSGATYSGGTQAATFTASSMVTQVGSTSGGGQPGGGGGGHGPGGWGW